jgi:hypothetical protein
VQIFSSAVSHQTFQIYNPVFRHPAALLNLKLFMYHTDTAIKVAFRTRNIIQNILWPEPQKDKYSRSGIYQMKRLDFPLIYVGKEEEHLRRDIKNTFKTLKVTIATSDIQIIFKAHIR